MQVELQYVGCPGRAGEICVTDLAILCDWRSLRHQVKPGRVLTIAILLKTRDDRPRSFKGGRGGVQASEVSTNELRHMQEVKTERLFRY